MKVTIKDKLFVCALAFEIIFVFIVFFVVIGAGEEIKRTVVGSKQQL